MKRIGNDEYKPKDEIRARSKSSSQACVAYACGSRGREGKGARPGTQRMRDKRLERAPLSCSHFVFRLVQMHRSAIYKNPKIPKNKIHYIFRPPKSKIRHPKKSIFYRSVNNFRTEHLEQYFVDFGSPYVAVHACSPFVCTYRLFQFHLKTF